MDTLATFITGWLCVWYGCKLWTMRRPLVLMDYARLAVLGWLFLSDRWVDEVGILKHGKISVDTFARL